MKNRRIQNYCLISLGIFLALTLFWLILDYCKYFSVAMSMLSICLGISFIGLYNAYEEKL